MLWAALLLPQLALDAVTRDGHDPAEALVLIDGPLQRRHVHAASAAAQAAGIRPGHSLAAAQALGVPPAVCIYVGDDERDMQAARAAGMGAIAASYGYTGDALHVQEWQPDAILNAPNDLLQLLRLA